VGSSQGGHLAPHLLDQPHHDGSRRYVDSSDLRLGDRVPVRLVVPYDYGETEVRLRVSHDGDPLKLRARLEREDTAGRWYTVDMPVNNPVVHYRWLVRRGDVYEWITGRGLYRRDVSDAGDFRTTVFPGAPAWSGDAIGYQIFPDRFARSGGDSPPPPAWATPAGWDDEPIGWGWASASQFYGGDLGGVAAHLDHIEALGANLIYLTPFFPAASAHRYDASSFDHVDPLLGGDAALAALTRAAHARGIRVIGDLTTNHTGDTHEWFKRAYDDRTSPEAAFYYWADRMPIDLRAWQETLVSQWDMVVPVRPDGRPHDYATFMGVAAMPKLNWGAPGLWDRMVRGPGSVAGRYLGAPFDLDGWRVDVAHMTGRFADDDYYAKVAAAMRATIDAAGGLLVAEHCFDISGDLLGDGWHSAMNYPAFTKPLWTWLTDPAAGLTFSDLPVPLPRRGGRDVVATMREFDASVPWKVFSRQWNMLGSHDTARIRSIVGDARLAEVALVWLFAYPGIPALFAGDEGGALGVNGEHGRTTLPWDQIAAGGGPRWDASLFQRYQAMIDVRRSSRALRDGGLRWAVVDDDALVFLREAVDETVLVVLARKEWAGTRLPARLTSGLPELLYGGRAALTPTLSVTPAGIDVTGDGPAVGVWRLA